ncbi:hypothetical protein [Riemerella anatipestifer]|uniref:hypothetical protein n=1 Tax=Riemerella anatipestifer TaxID=34085 RepID=UPI001BD9E8FA|nr:hypothetical protein [Riemerella anatipestifer]MBT0551584.1 hypothetical protein [Riemerella anatipestifer]MBT0552731.1 hypothetical protein [Riemerella anatipestifer]MCE3023468.1 hypothetical protein [Riemerella anatipestifer]MCU7558947.1 hypothetical protein [Riemerella anatipestifer]MDY3448132.1 hypothetical protein [Riemerella anatipestifer]
MKKIVQKLITPLVRKILKEEIKEIERLKYHESITIGLWAIDRNPQEVSYEWIKENAYQIKPTSTCPECKH